MKDLQRFKTMVDALRDTNSRNFKMKILEKYPENKELLQIVMDPFQRFNVTKKSILNTRYTYSGELIIPNSVEGLIKILGKFATREISGNTALGICAVTITQYHDFKDLLLCIFNKNLEIRIGDKDVNKVWPGLIPTYDVCLAKSVDDKLLEKIRNEPEDWLIMRKLDGLRNACEYVNYTATSKSRNGNIFTSLQKVNAAIINMMAKFPDDVVFDGEICVVDAEGNEDFSQAVSQVKRKDTEMEHPKYIIFDVIDYEDFIGKSGEVEYIDRLNRLEYLLGKNESPYLDMIQAVPFTDDNYKMMKVKCAKEGWEGLMLRKNVGYEGKRTKNLLKVKEFFTEEFKVLAPQYGPFRAISEETGLEETINTLTSVRISYKDNYVDVGSGFTLAQRKEFYEHPERIVGKTITVQYFEESKNKEGGISLRFPTLKKIWENGRDV